MQITIDLEVASFEYAMDECAEQVFRNIKSNLEQNGSWWHGVHEGRVDMTFSASDQELEIEHEHCLDISQEVFEGLVELLVDLERAKKGWARAHRHEGTVFDSVATHYRTGGLMYVGRSENKVIEPVHVTKPDTRWRMPRHDRNINDWAIIQTRDKTLTLCIKRKLYQTQADGTLRDYYGGWYRNEAPNLTGSIMQIAPFHHDGKRWEMITDLRPYEEQLIFDFGLNTF